MREVDVVDPATGEVTGQIDLEDLLDAKGKRLDALGREIPDPRPMAPPVGFRRQPSLMETVRDMVRSEKLRAEVESAGMESFEEADDFAVGDDYDPTSPYEMEFEPTPLPELRRRRDADKAAMEAKEGVRKAGMEEERPAPRRRPAGSAEDQGDPVDNPVD